MESKKANAECNEVSPKKVQLSSSIMKCATTGKKDETEKNEIQDDDLNIYEKIDNTNPELNLRRLLSNKSDKLLFKNFNVLSKTELSMFDINKKINNREAYFYFLECLINVEIIGDSNKSESDSGKITVQKKDSKEPKIKIDFSQGAIVIGKTSQKATDNNDIINKENENYGEMINRLNVDIVEYFTFNELITVKDLRQKMKTFYENLTFKEEKLNNIPDFESELYYHYQLQNILESFEESDDEEFEDKIYLIKNVSQFIYNVKNNKIKDRLILNYFYFIMDVENEIDPILQKNAEEYEEKYDFKNCEVDKEKNELIINDNKKITNFDCYIIKENDIEKIKENKIPLSSILKESCYSLKGNLLFRELTEKEGNEIYENFIKSNLLKDIFQLLYGIDIKSLTPTLLVEFFQNNTFYFPIKNRRYSAYCDKKCFKIIVDYSIDERNIKDLPIGKKIILFIKKSFMTLNIHHEFGYGHQVVLFCINPEKNEFDSPLVELKLDSQKTKITGEGGQLFEYLLYRRVIKELDLKEVIYINNSNNCKKSLKQYRDDFINLKNKKLKEVFDMESKNNEEISEIYKLYKKLPKDVRKKLKNISFKSGRATEENDDKKCYDLEKVVFSTDKLRKPHDKHKRNHK